MNIRLGRAAILALLFLGSQAAPGLHAAFEAGHDLHACCTDNEAATHFDVCDADHHAHECQICATIRSQAFTAAEHGFLSLGIAASPRRTVSEVGPADPFHVETPDSRGPPA